MPRTYYVYILSNRRRTLYVGVTNNLLRRLDEHAQGIGSAYVRQHKLRRLVHVELAYEAADAIRREKQIKGWLRSRKVALIESTNPGWDDLMSRWGMRPPLDSRGARRV